MSSGSFSSSIGGGSSSSLASASINSNSITIGTSPGPGWSASVGTSFDDYAPVKAKTHNIELHLLNGQKIVKYIDWNKVYDLKELRKRTFKLTKKFPFIKTSSFPYTQFKYRTQYEFLNSWCDEKYKVDCPLSAFMSLIGVGYEQFEEAVVEDAIKNGS